MKKSLIALAVLAASGAAMAQSSVTLYGIANATFVKDKGESAKLISGGMSTSRWGVKGSEDLGGGLSATFRFEQGIDLTNGNIKGAAFGRQANLGLAGGFGEIKLGKTGNPYDDIAWNINPVFDSLLTPAEIAPSLATSNAKPDSGVYYASPTFGGVSGAFGTSFKTGADNLRVTAFNVQYAGGPVFVGLVYENQDGDTTSVKNTRLIGSYDLGVAKLLAGYGNTKDTSDDFTFGVDVPLSPALVLSTGFTQVRPDVGANASGFGLGVNYSISKRTSVYGGFRKDNKEAAANWGGVESRVAMGLRHAF
jgi:predicted porin